MEAVELRTFQRLKPVSSPNPGGRFTARNGVEELLHTAARRELYDVERLMPTQCGLKSRPAVPVVVPDPAVEREVEPFRASRRLGRRAAVQDRPAKRADDAREAAASDDDDRVRTGEPNIERPAVVAIGDPPLGAEQFSLALPPLVLPCLDPSRIPEVLIEMDHREPGSRTERAGERGLPGAAGANDRYAMHPHSLPQRQPRKRRRAPERRRQSSGAAPNARPRTRPWGVRQPHLTAHLQWSIC